MSRSSQLKTTLFTLFALIAFAANSIICRMALKSHHIDPYSFTTIRLLSGMIVLWLLLIGNKKTRESGSKGSWLSAVMLFIYALAFSKAYMVLDTGTGALILFTSVQVTMITASVLSGKKMSFTEWSGLFIAFCGLCIFGIT